jgi:predicted RNase H-like HicB family nuclease
MGKRTPLEGYLALEYPALLVAEPEGRYTALHPDLKGCVAVGGTPEEALANLEEARRLWLEVAHERGDEIPFRARGMGRAASRQPLGVGSSGLRARKKRHHFTPASNPKREGGREVEVKREWTLVAH